jgi:hypothetical protein
MDNKDHYDEVSDGNEQYFIGNWRKGNPYYIIIKQK